MESSKKLQGQGIFPTLPPFSSINNSPNSVMEGSSEYDQINKEIKERKLQQETHSLEIHSKLLEISSPTDEVQKIDIKSSIHRHSDAKLTSSISIQLPKSSYAVQENRSQDDQTMRDINVTESTPQGELSALSPLMSARIQEYNNHSLEYKPQILSLENKLKERSARSKSLQADNTNFQSTIAYSPNRLSSSPEIHSNSIVTSLKSRDTSDNGSKNPELQQQRMLQKSGVTTISSIQHSGNDNSSWSAGKELIETFGHESPGQAQTIIPARKLNLPNHNLDESCSPIQQFDYQGISLAQNIFSSPRQVSNARTVIYNPVTEAFVDDYMYSTTPTSTDIVSVAAISSKRGSTSYMNKLHSCNLDATPNILRNNSGNGSIYSKTLNRSSLVPNQGITPPSSVRYNNNGGFRNRNNSIVTFTNSIDKKGKDPFNDISFEQPEKIVDGWRYFLVTLCCIFGILFVYALVFALAKQSEDQTSIKSLDEVYDYITNLNKTGRQETLKKLSYLYPSEFTELTSNVSKNVTFKDPIKLTSNFTTLGAGINSFQGINSKYKGDYEIRDLMVGDNFNQKLFGMNYAPKNVIEPICGVTQREVTLDVARMSTITSRIRTYGTHCDQSKMILNAFQELNLNMSLSLGIWISGNDYSNWRQMNSLKVLLSDYPRKYFDSIYIGNEVLFRGEINETELIEFIHEAKRYADSLGYFNLPVGTSETGASITKKLIEEVDFIGVNVHPFFGGVSSNSSIEWAFDFLNNQVVPFRDRYNKDCSIVISEIGWPYSGGQFMNAKATSNDYQNFLNQWICKIKDKDYQWYFFEAFDEPWKQIWYDRDNKWETEWGFFTKDRNTKENIQLPVCEN